MKKAVRILIAIILIFAVGGSAYFYMVPLFTEDSNAEKESLVYVKNVQELVDGFKFTSNRYSGVVETEDLIKVDADSEKKIKQTFVKEGDVVKKGDTLFEYDVDEMQIQLEQKKVDMAQQENDIRDYNTQIEALEKEKKTLSTNKQLTITNQIEGLKLEIKKAEYEKDSLDKEIKKLEISVKSSVVKSAVNGTIESVDNPDIDSYITIASDGDFRIKALVSELNVSEFSENDEITIRSRVDDSTWKGNVVSIDTAKPVTDTSSGMMGGESATKYPVYISIEDTEGMLIGQHVTIERSSGVEEKEGLWIEESYIKDADTSPYVWAEGSNNKIEKRNIELGEHDEELGQYEVLSGITFDDYIAFPEDRITAGMDVTYTYSANESEMNGAEGSYQFVEVPEDQLLEDAAESTVAG